MTTKMPTDLVLIETIYQQNYNNFANFSDTNKTRSSKIWLPLNIEDLANHFKLDADIIFGRLYYHLNEKYSHQKQDGTKSEFFAIRIGADHHCINFPYLSSILATLKDEQGKFMITTVIAGLSLIISITSMIVAIMS